MRMMVMNKVVMISKEELILVNKSRHTKKSQILSFKLGIDPSLSARIERDEKEANTTSAGAASRPKNSMENTGIFSINILTNLNQIYFFR